MSDKDQLGFTCAACHTGHLEYNGVSLRVDGGPAVTNLGSFQENLGLVLTFTQYVPFRFDRIPPEVRARLDGERPNCVKASGVYKARPLNGIWATPPFLHNGSVATLWDLLSPLTERVAQFCTGSRRFNPTKVGYETACRDGDFELDTRIAGNRNTGHEFRDGPRGNGVIGPTLSDAERWDLIAYLKSL